MYIGAKTIGKLKNLTYVELQEIINHLPKSLSYSYKCNWIDDENPLEFRRYSLWIFKNKQ